MELQGKRALVTGATGFIGGHLARRLQAHEGVHVRALVRDPGRAANLQDLGIELLQGDITDLEACRRACQGMDLVFHAAAYVGEGGDWEAVRRVNVQGTENLLQAAVEAGVQRFIHISTCAVYGSLQAFGIDESFPLRRRGDPYGDTKVEAEEAVWRVHREQGLPVVVARPSQVYGPGSREFTIRPVQAIQEGKMVLIDGGRHLCKPIYIDDLIDGLVLCATHEAAVGEAFNFTNDAPVPWKTFFGAYGRMLGVDRFPSLPYPAAWLVALVFELRAALQGRRANVNRKAVQALRSTNSFSNRKAKAILGWQPSVSLEEGMRRTEEWLRREGFLAAPQRKADA